MGLSACASVTDPTGRELVVHGTAAFPVACYADDLQKEGVPWHWHEELELAVVTAGSCTFAAGGEKCTLRAGEGIFVNASVLHSAWSSGGEAGVHSVVFHPRLVGGSADSVFFRQYLRPLTEGTELEYLRLTPEFPWHRQLLSHVEAAWQACVWEGPGYEFTVRQQLSDLVFKLYRQLAPQAGLPAGKNSRDSQRIKRMLSFIHENYSQELSVGQIAASACLSPSACLRCFKSAIGTTPAQYLRQYRLQQAAVQLRQGPESIGDIAFACGFSDVSYFTRAFRAEKGCTPSEYRRKG